MSGNFAIKGGGGFGPLMANAILNFHFDFLTTSLTNIMSILSNPIKINLVLIFWRFCLLQTLCLESTFLIMIYLCCWSDLISDQPDRYDLTPPTTGTNTHLSIPIITNYYQDGNGCDLIGAVASTVASRGSQQVKVESGGAPSSL